MSESISRWSALLVVFFFLKAEPEIPGPDIIMLKLKERKGTTSE